MTISPSAPDLIAAANWSCSLDSINASHELTVLSTDGFNSIWLTDGPRLQVSGDFSVIAKLAPPTSAGALTLVWKWPASGDDWWKGLLRLDITIGNPIGISLYLGTSANPTTMTLPLPQGITAPTQLEVARLSSATGTQIVIFVDGVEAGRFVDPGLFNSGYVYYGFTGYPKQSLTYQTLAAAVPSTNPSNITLDYPTATLPPAPAPLSVTAPKPRDSPSAQPSNPIISPTPAMPKPWAANSTSWSRKPS